MDTNAKEKQRKIKWKTVVLWLFKMKNIIAWKHNKYLSRSIQLNAPRIFMDQLDYKCDWNEVEFIKIPKSFPSTQICSNCKEKK